MVADLATAAGAQQVLDAAADIGPVDILVNNVGYFEVKPFAEISDADWLAMFELNVMSGVRLTRGLFDGHAQAQLGTRGVYRQRAERQAQPRHAALRDDQDRAGLTRARPRGIDARHRRDGEQRAGGADLVGGCRDLSRQDRTEQGKTVDEMRTAYFDGPGRTHCCNAGRHRKKSPRRWCSCVRRALLRSTVQHNASMAASCARCSEWGRFNLLN